MHEKSLSSAEVRFIDRDQVIRDLRQAAAEARSRYPEIAKVLLIGSLVKGNWTADSDADLIVVVRKEFRDLLERSRYQIFTKSIPTDTLVFSEAEFELLSKDLTSFPAQDLRFSLEL